MFPHAGFYVFEDPFVQPVAVQQFVQRSSFISHERCVLGTRANVRGLPFFGLHMTLRQPFEQHSFWLDPNP